MARLPARRGKAIRGERCGHARGDDRVLRVLLALPTAHGAHVDRGHRARGTHRSAGTTGQVGPVAVPGHRYADPRGSGLDRRLRGRGGGRPRAGPVGGPRRRAGCPGRDGHGVGRAAQATSRHAGVRWTRLVDARDPRRLRGGRRGASGSRNQRAGSDRSHSRPARFGPAQPRDVRGGLPRAHIGERHVARRAARCVRHGRGMDRTARRRRVDRRGTVWHRLPTSTARSRS